MKHFTPTSVIRNPNFLVEKHESANRLFTKPPFFSIKSFVPKTHAFLERRAWFAWPAREGGGRPTSCALFYASSSHPNPKTRLFLPNSTQAAQSGLAGCVQALELTNQATCFLIFSYRNGSFRPPGWPGQPWQLPSSFSVTEMASWGLRGGPARPSHFFLYFLFQKWLPEASRAARPALATSFSFSLTKMAP